MEELYEDWLSAVFQSNCCECEGAEGSVLAPGAVKIKIPSQLNPRRM
jgi:hypothetical protein